MNEKHTSLISKSKIRSCKQINNNINNNNNITIVISHKNAHGKSVINFKSKPGKSSIHHQNTNIQNHHSNKVHNSNINTGPGPGGTFNIIHSGKSKGVIDNKSNIAQTSATVDNQHHQSQTALPPSPTPSPTNSHKSAVVPFVTATNDTHTDITEQVKDLLKQNNYNVIKYIDRGSTSVVYKVSNGKGEVWAAKVIDHSKISPMILKQFLPNELSIVRIIQHPYIIQTDNVFENSNYSVIVAEFATDGDLISYIEKISKPNILLAKRWLSQIVQALVYLHSLGIAHRDIKADNVLLCSGTAKLSDFGYAQYSIDKSTRKVIPCTTFCGTLEYKAPETLLCNAPFDPFIADCFSLGVLLYTLVTLEFPFGSGPELRTSAGVYQLYKDIQKKKWQINEEIKNDRRLYSLLKQLLNPDIDERIQSSQILQHPWFNDLHLRNPSEKRKFQNL